MTSLSQSKPGASAWQVTVCRGSESCTAGLVSLAPLATALEETMQRSGWCAYLQQAYPHGHRPHHRLRIALAACPNSCSQPQICDIGIIAWSLPQVNPNVCTACGACISVCREDALRLGEQRIVLDPASCVGCVACTRVCATDALHAPPPLFRLLLGGHLGRHPAWAIELPLRLAPDQLCAAVERVVELLIQHALPGERVGQTIRRVGIPAFTEAVQSMRTIQTLRRPSVRGLECGDSSPL